MDNPNTSGVITPLVALNDSNLFKNMLKTCDGFKIHSVWCTAYITPAATNTLKHIVTFSDRTGIEDDLNPDYVNSYGSAKHYIANSNAQSRVQWNGLTNSGIIESSTWGQADNDGEGVIPEEVQPLPMYAVPRGGDIGVPLGYITYIAYDGEGSLQGSTPE